MAIPNAFTLFFRQFENSLLINGRNFGSDFLPFSDCFGELSTTSILTEEEFDDSFCGLGVGSEVISSIKGMFSVVLFNTLNEKYQASSEKTNMAIKIIATGFGNDLK